MFSYRLAHSVLKTGVKFGAIKFERALNNAEQAQQARYKKILKTASPSVVADRYHLSKHTSIEQFQRNVPISKYEDWLLLIDQQRGSDNAIISNESIKRYQPTSGSRSSIKWIPYSNSFLSELDAAIAPWVSDLYHQFPNIRFGSHYWSLSWLPTNLRNKLTSEMNDDLQLMPYWKRLLMARSMAVPNGIAEANTSEQSMFATLCYLVANQHLSMISVWSPTFLLNLIDGMATYKEEIAATLKYGQWALFERDLAFLAAPQAHHAADLLQEWDGNIETSFFHSLWPQLALISSWDTSTSALWAKKIQQLFSFCGFQGKGLWATEGAITIPFKGQYPLCVTSHFYEFIDVDTGKVHLPWQLNEGQLVQPVITTGSGLLRYSMKDKLIVSGFMGKTPCFTFLSRIDSIDMVGEKISIDVANEIIAHYSQYEDIQPLSLLALPDAGDSEHKPKYVLLATGSVSEERQKELTNLLETKLCEHFHYQLARDLQQLLSATCLVVSNALEIYQSLATRKNMIVGNMKIEPLILWDKFLPKELSLNNKQSESDATRVAV